jgi:1,4-alpha-glucan branching enzyme
MATKKVSAKTVVAEQPVKTAKTTPAPVAKKVAAPAKAEKAPVAKKAVAAEKTVIAPATSKVTFTLPKEVAENAETVAVLGDFNNWQNGVSLKKQKDGSFTTAIELEKGRSYEFRFLINGEKWENAPNAEAYKPTPFGAYNSVVTA